LSVGKVARVSQSLYSQPVLYKIYLQKHFADDGGKDTGGLGEKSSKGGIKKMLKSTKIVGNLIAIWLCCLVMNGLEVLFLSTKCCF